MKPSTFAFTREVIFKLIIVLATMTLLSFSPLLIKPIAKLKGMGLNSRAWRATFAERHLPVPPGGPREGYWGSRIHYYPRDPEIGALFPETHFPGLEVDKNGRQYASSDPHPNIRILIIGGSVAFGAYASRDKQTYFHKLALRLGRLHHRVKIIIQATGGWTSANELAAFKKLGLPLHPDYVMILDGMNDLMLERDIPEELRVSEYLERMREIRDLALAHGIKVIFVPQPFLPEKDVKSALEVIILSESYYPMDKLVAAWARLRQGVNALAIPGKAYVVDCSDIFDDVHRTIFTDIFHFTDIGQARLARILAQGLDPILNDGVAKAHIPLNQLPGA
jgi:lysophospholipase L1-like esterase